jgi:hypothetical protein
MKKISQQRTMWQKLKENANVGGMIVEKFSPEMGELFKKLKELDAAARGTAVDARLGEYIKASKSSFKSKNILNTVDLLSQFHSQIYGVVKLFGQIDELVKNQHRLLVSKDEDLSKYLGLKNKFEQKKSSDLEIKVILIKTAGILSYLKDKFTESAWEKRYPKQTKKLKQELATLLSSSETLYLDLMKLFSDLADARASRKIEEYVDLTKGFGKKYQKYDQFFKKFYKENISQFLDLVSPAVSEQPPSAPTQAPASLLQDDLNKTVPSSVYLPVQSDKPSENNEDKPVEQSKPIVKDVELDLGEDKKVEKSKPQKDIAKIVKDIQLDAGNENKQLDKSKKEDASKKEPVKQEAKQPKEQPKEEASKTKVEAPPPSPSNDVLNVGDIVEDKRNSKMAVIVKVDNKSQKAMVEYSSGGSKSVVDFKSLKKLN